MVAHKLAGRVNPNVAYDAWEAFPVLLVILILIVISRIKTIETKTAAAGYLRMSVRRRSLAIRVAVLIRYMLCYSAAVAHE